MGAEYGLSSAGPEAGRVADQWMRRCLRWGMLGGINP